MDLKQHCLDAALKLMLVIAEKWDTVVSKMNNMYMCLYQYSGGSRIVKEVSIE